MFFSRHRHNRMVKKAVEYYPIRFSEDSPPGRSHPWQIRPEWRKVDDSGKGEWTGVIQPGCVNGQPAYINTLFKHARPEAQARIKEERLQAKLPEATPETRVKVYLDEQAALPFAWRSIGSDGVAESVSGNADSGAVTGVFEKVPDFFKRLGVADANTNLLGEAAATQRLLRACDIVLYQPRLAMTNEVTVGAVVDGVIASVNPGFNLPTDLEPRVTATAKFVAPSRNVSLQSVFFDRFIDEPYDLVHLSTVYALSPVLPLLDTAVSQAWQIYVKYNLHWNLVHAPQRIVPRTELQPITLFVPLAGGVAQPVISEILAQNNDWAQAALDFYQQRNLQGKFYAV